MKLSPITPDETLLGIARALDVNAVRMAETEDSREAAAIALLTLGAIEDWLLSQMAIYRALRAAEARPEPAAPPALRVVEGGLAAGVSTEETNDHA